MPAVRELPPSNDAESDVRHRANHRVAYFNGKIVPEREVVLPFRDRGFKYGDAAFDMTRTFSGRPFKLKEHIERLYRSLRYLRIDPGLGQEEMVAASEEVLDAQPPFPDPGHRLLARPAGSRGVDAVGDEGWDHTGPNVIVECIPLPLKNRARLFRDGIDIVVPPTRRVAPDMLSPRAKTHNYLNLVMADLEAKAQDKEAWSVLLDAQGHLAEGIGSNIFVVRDGDSADAARTLGPARGEPRRGDRIVRRDRHPLPRGRSRHLRRRHRRRDLHELDELVHVPGAQHRRPAAAAADPGPGDAAADRGLWQLRRLRFRRAVPEALGLNQRRRNGRNENGRNRGCAHCRS